MLPLQLPSLTDRPLQVLLFGAHADDIEIGCGGTLLTMLSEGSRLEVTWVICSASSEREREARESAETYLGEVARRTIRVESFPDGFLPYRGEEVKQMFERLKGEVTPDLIFTHHGNDAHQDHRLIRDLTWNTFRNHTILEYEIPKYDGDLGRPGIYVPLDEAMCRRKIELLLEHFPTQRDKPWFSDETFWAVLRIRGIEARSPTGYAEAFHAPKLTLELRGEELSAVS